MLPYKLGYMNLIFGFTDFIFSKLSRRKRKIKYKIWEVQHLSYLCILHFTKFKFNLK